MSTTGQVAATQWFDAQALTALRARLSALGRPVPDESMSRLFWHEAWSCWRVQLPMICGGGQHYFSPKDYGGREEALIEAQFFRDDAFRKAGVDIHARICVTRKRIDRGMVMPISVGFDARLNSTFITGYWMMTAADGKSKQQKVKRYVGRRSFAQAWAEVEAIVQKGIEEESRRMKVLGAQRTSASRHVMKDAHAPA